MLTFGTCWQFEDFTTAVHCFLFSWKKEKLVHVAIFTTPDI